MATISNSGDLTSPRKIAALATCVAVICGAAILWQVYKEKAIHRRFAEDARISRASAEQGDAKAQFNLGKIYFHGQGVPRDYAEAVRWYRKAADQGDANAQYALGLMYHYGQAVPQDDAEAVRWYAKIAASCFASAQARPLQRWISILVLVLALPVLAVPKRRGGTTSLPSALLSADLAAALAHTLLLSDSSLTLLDRVLPGTLFSGFGRVLWLAFLAVGSATFAIAAVVQAVRGSKRSRPALN